MRAPIEKIVLTPGPNRGEINAMLYGELGTMLNWMERQDIDKSGKKTKPAAFATGLSVSMVAGACFHLNLRRTDLLHAAKDLLGAEGRIGLFRSTA